MRKFLIITASILLIIFFIITSTFVAYSVITKGAVLDGSKLTGSGQHVIILDDDGNELTSASLEIQKRVFQSINYSHTP